MNQIAPTLEIPTIDLTPLLAPKPGETPAECHDAIHAACTETGFFVAVGHGLDLEMSNAFGAAREFFALAQVDKEAVPRRDRYGFVPHEDLAIDQARTHGVTEYLDVGLADEVTLPSELANAIRAYQAPALAVGLALLTALARTLGLPGDTFDAAMREPQCRLRFLHYFATRRIPGETSRELTLPHTDYGLITLLATDGVPGLEVQPIGRGWIPVVAPAGSLVINLGDMLARWTNDRFRSTPHRVLASPDNDRFSIPFFVNPNPATLIECLPACVSADRPCQYEPVTAGDFLAARIDGRL